MGNIHKLTEVLLPGEANSDLVEALQGLLARAERGEITSMAWAYYTGPDSDTAGTGWEGAGGSTFVLHSAIGSLAYRYAKFLNDED